MMVDGGSMFGQVPKSEWELYMKPDRKNRVRVGLNCLLIRGPAGNILINTGAGAKLAEKLKDSHGLQGNKLLKGLKKLGITARDIDTVVLTDLQFDVAGGCTKLDRSGKAIPAFPKANYIVQKAAWDEANSPDERGRKLYNREDFLPLEEAEVLTLADGDIELCPGVNSKVTSGYSDGHQIVLVEAGSERIAFLAHLVPTPFHIALSTMTAFDKDPGEVLNQKREIISMAVNSGWMMIFGLAQEQGGAYVEQRNGKSQLLPVAI
jgi:glyoxylase-like metal-dependent hydrolase (beta-lactamase superfamily II)